MAADILPLGEAMVTRAPLSLQLIHAARRDQMRAEFGVFVDGIWRADATVALACPDPTSGQLREIRRAIEEQTEARAGNKKGVSAEAIYMRLYSPNVPNLSLVDLPGLTMTALTDQGQPRDIKAQIRRMVSSYIRSERTIILMVCPARTDLEVDAALELVKEHDPTGARTVGVLTKVRATCAARALKAARPTRTGWPQSPDARPSFCAAQIDLMNEGTDVSNYLTNGVPADLQLAHGYFAVRNRSPAEAKSLSVPRHRRDRRCGRRRRTCPLACVAGARRLRCRGELLLRPQDLLGRERAVPRAARRAAPLAIPLARAPHAPQGAHAADRLRGARPKITISTRDLGMRSRRGRGR